MKFSLLLVVLLCAYCANALWFGKKDKNKNKDRNGGDGGQHGGGGHRGGDSTKGQRVVKWGWDDLRDKLKCDESCSFDVDGVIDDIKNTLSGNEPLPFKGITPCRKCTFLGAATITRSQEFCKAPSLGGKGCMLNIVQFTISNLSVNCSCSLPQLPDTLARLFDEASATAKTAPCSFDSEQTEAKNIRFKNFVPKPASTTPSCAPIATISPRRTVPAKTTATWNDVQVTMMFGTCRHHITPQVWSTHILNEDYDEIQSQCISIADGKASCKCFHASGMMQSVVNHFIEKYLPCYLNTKINLLDGLSKRFECGKAAV